MCHAALVTLRLLHDGVRPGFQLCWASGIRGWGRVRFGLHLELGIVLSCVAQSMWAAPHGYGEPISIENAQDPQWKGCHRPVQLDTALVVEGTLHDGVQGHQGDVIKDLQGRILTNVLPSVLWEHRWDIVLGFHDSLMLNNQHHYISRFLVQNLSL